MALVKQDLGTQVEELKNFVDVQQDWIGERPAKFQKNSECLYGYDDASDSNDLSFFY